MKDYAVVKPAGMISSLKFNILCFFIDPLQVQFLSSAIDLPILQYFQKGYQDFYGQPIKDYEVIKPAGMTASVKAQNKDCVFLLWVCESQKLYIDGGRLDYVVPVVKKVG